MRNSVCINQNSYYSKNVNHTKSEELMHDHLLKLIIIQNNL